ncbi:DUF192 domain-containing protein [Celeribacter arenosi]|uniref:DUF192 domain-containing protein n=1 Tax=Celeribacter arenosi TaxID=792649 RepID=A0ABP7KD05_9RHOB
MLTRHALTAAALCFLGTAAVGQSVCDPSEVIVTSGATQVRFSVEIADDASERSLGLMHRETLPRSSGMLFIYDELRPVSFWMQNTLIPLDIIFVDEKGIVVRVHENAVPLDRTQIPSGAPVRAVLEVNGGLSAALGIQKGATLRHPAFGFDAEDACLAQ